MAMVCPKCSGSFEQSLCCPSCGVRLLYETKGRRAGDNQDGTSNEWLHTPIGRIVAGILLAQGLAYGMQMLCTAGLLATTDATQETLWSTLFGLILLQALQGLSLLIGGAVAGAGQRRAIVVGAVVGLTHGVLFLLIQHLQGEPITEIALYGQPVLHIGFGVVGAVIGSTIWRPLPTVAMPDSEPEKNMLPRGKSGLAILRGPVAWSRVFAGIIVVTVGFVWSPALLHIILDASQAKLKTNDRLQAQLVTWEIMGLCTLLGAAIAGATTRNGFKQGLHVGLGASVVLIGNYLGGSSVAPEQIGYTFITIMGLTMTGGWFGGQLFPPVASVRRRHSSAAA